MLSKCPIRNKLLIGLALLMVIVVTLSWGGIRGIYAYRSLVKSLGRRVSELPLAGEFSICVSDLRVALSETRNLHDLHAAGLSSTGFSVRLAREEFRTKLRQAEEILESYRDRLSDNPDPTAGISDRRHEWETVYAIEAAMRRIESLNHDEDWMLDEVQTGQLSSQLEHLQGLAAQLPGFLQQNVREFAEDARTQYRALIVLSWITTATTICMFALFVRLFYQWIFRPLRVLVNGSRMVASGQFSHRIRLETNDEMAELAAAMNDMTERFQAVRDDLDRQVQERTRQVVRGEQLASVGFLAAGVAHEINNPLASIAMSAESLESRMVGLLPAEGEQTVVRDYLRMIQNEAFRCKQITEKLLDFSRIGTATRQNADLRELVSDVIEMLGHLGKYQEKQIELLPGGPILVDVNVQEMKQVVLNLLTNALESLDARGTVTIELSRHQDEVEMIVSDNGCGMTADVLEHLFEPFFTRRRGGQGTGLGLSITYRIIADHDGTIEAHSDGPGQGSQFHVRLPLADSAKEFRHRYQATQAT